MAPNLGSSLDHSGRLSWLLSCHHKYTWVLGRGWCAWSLQSAARGGLVHYLLAVGADSILMCSCA